MGLMAENPPGVEAHICTALSGGIPGAAPSKPFLSSRVVLCHAAVRCRVDALALPSAHGRVLCFSPCTIQFFITSLFPIVVKGECVPAGAGPVASLSPQCWGAALGGRCADAEFLSHTYRC